MIRVLAGGQFELEFLAQEDRQALFDLFGFGLRSDEAEQGGRCHRRIGSSAASADLPERVRRVVAVNPYDYAGGIARSDLLARLIVTGVLAPGIGPIVARQEPRPIMRAVLRGGVVDKAAIREDYLDELLGVGRRPGYPTVARAVYASLPSLIDARSRYPDVTAPVHLIYGDKDWSRPSDRQANKQLLPAAEFIEVSSAGHFIALERPDVPAELLNAVA